MLDFWLGDWEVWSAGRFAGTDRVSKIVGGCAVAENWTAADGSLGQGVFFYLPLEKRWKQVWISDVALRPGGLKEKSLILRFPDGGTRFQGEIALPDGRRILDRTTLRPMPSGSVYQRIEHSSDGGDRWTTDFEAEYRATRNSTAAAAASAPAPAAATR